MSEDVKPRIWTLVFDHDEEMSYVRPRAKYSKSNRHDEHVDVIELEPTMRLMDDMADAFNKINQAKKMFIQFRDAMYVEVIDKETKEVLEKYRKFKEGLK